MSFYFLDMFTDLQFTLNQFNKAARNFSSEMNACEPDFDAKFNKTILYCQGDFNPTKCLNLLDTVKTIGEDCFNIEQRFISNPEEWNTAGIISAIHCALPIVMALLIWLIQNEFKICSEDKLFLIPFPFVSILYKFHFTRKLFSVYTMDRNKT